ncbi:hypothetical protein L6259_02055 [Candidatus Parcubacteria bacterium]|nr:hypothetical protein [Patescibacteria group bacterium]MCG2694034.1 hypothetical protein [Candidatus Parcubacteria bacterium]
MELQLFIYKNIALHFYYFKDSLENGTINSKNIFVYFPGLPQMIDEDFFVNKVDKNTAFFSVYYLGSWLSGDSFTYKNCKKTVELAVEFVKHKQGIKTFDDKQINWNYNNLYVMGYSFSGNPVVSAKITKNDVKNVILFAPLLFLHKKEVLESMKNRKIIDNFYGFNSFYLEFLRRGYKFALRGIERKSWDKYFSGKESKSLIKTNKDYPDTIIFHGKSDEKIQHTSSLFFQKEKYPEAKVFLKDGVGHDLEKLFDMNQINKII